MQDTQSATRGHEIDKNAIQETNRVYLVTIATSSTAAVMAMMLRRTLGIKQQVRLQEALVQPVEQVSCILTRGIQDGVDCSSCG
jgi:hypothetical protein